MEPQQDERPRILVVCRTGTRCVPVPDGWLDNPSAYARAVFLHRTTILLQVLTGDKVETIVDRGSWSV